VPRVAILLGVSAALAAVPLASAFAQDSAASPVQKQLPSFALMAETVLPAVVNISVVRNPQAAPAADEENAPEDQRSHGTPGRSPNDESMRRFFDQQPGRAGFGAHERLLALGSGFIIDPAGYVVTNNHVLGNAAKVTVLFQDGSEHRARIVGTDTKTDLALLKIDAPKPLPYLQWGDSDRARVGDWVMAVGNPFGLGGTVTNGIVSARSRSIDNSAYVAYLQIDAAVNRGSSGGPTFDLAGHVIGINSQIYSPTGGNVGIAFDIPSDTAKAVIDEIKTTGHVDRGYLGVQIQQLTPDLAAAVGIVKDGPQGELVSVVTRDSPAAKAGLQVGDVIEQMNGKPIAKIGDLPRMVGETPAGQAVHFTVLRQGETLELDATVGQLDETTVASAETGGAAPRTEPSVFGMTLSPLSPAIRGRLRLGREAAGAVVSYVTNGSPAANIGLEGGDLVERVNSQLVDSPEEAMSLFATAEKSPTKPILLLVNRGGVESFIALPQTTDQG